jgi:hypothetical protein
MDPTGNAAEGPETAPRQTSWSAFVPSIHAWTISVISLTLLPIVGVPEAFADMPLLPFTSPDALGIGFFALGGILALVFIVGVIGWRKIRKKYARD